MASISSTELDQFNIDFNELPYISPTKLWINNSASNYVVWRTLVFDHLYAQGFHGFIDGTNLPQPKITLNQAGEAGKATTNQDYMREYDELIKQWVLSLLEDDVIAPAEVDGKTCREVWLELQNKFERNFGRTPIYGADERTRASTEYLSLNRAALLGSYEAAKHIFQNEVGALKKTLQVVVACPNGFVRPNRLVAIPTRNMLQVHTPPKYTRKEVLEYLISIDNSDEHTSYEVSWRLALLMSAIDAELLDIAFDLVKKYPYLARLKFSSESALKCIASKKSLFLGPIRFARWERVINNRLTRNVVEYCGRDFGGCGYFCIKDCLGLISLPYVLLRFLGLADGPQRGHSVPRAVHLVSRLCEYIKDLSSEAEEIYHDAILLAAKLGMHQIVDVIVHHFPDAAFCSDPASFQYIFHMAVETRSPKMFKLIYRNISHEKHLLDLPDINGNNILHLAGRLSPHETLDEIPGAMLQMQHEMQWYKDIEKLVSPVSRGKPNADGKSPKMIFIEEHKELKGKAEKWMKDTSYSCTIIAALISTIMFAAAITVPGGQNIETGFPNFSGNSIFVLFAISDAVSLLTSATSLLVFLDILMTRYEEDDFLHHLPSRLIFGLGGLLISIMFMMVTFSVTLYLVFGQLHRWVLITVAAVACYIAMLFIYLQSPLLFDLIVSTHGNGYFPRGDISMYDHRDEPL